MKFNVVAYVEKMHVFKIDHASQPKGAGHYSASKSVGSLAYPHGMTHIKYCILINLGEKIVKFHRASTGYQRVSNI